MPVIEAGQRRRLPSKDVAIAAVALMAIGVHLALRWTGPRAAWVGGLDLADGPLLAALGIGGLPLVFGLAARLVRREFSSDLLAGISIVTAVILGEYLAGTLVVLMLSGGQAIESYAVRSASSALEALVKRMPTRAHRREDGVTTDVALDDIAPGDLLVVFPHETCPVDGIVVEGRSTMDESYLTGEPYVLSKAVGASVLSGAINGEGALTIRAARWRWRPRASSTLSRRLASPSPAPTARRRSSLSCARSGSGWRSPPPASAPSGSSGQRAFRRRPTPRPIR